jgi:hypothetical protein
MATFEQRIKAERQIDLLKEELTTLLENNASDAQVAEKGAELENMYEVLEFIQLPELPETLIERLKSLGVQIE